MAELTFASVFSGCGGFDLGFAQEGFRSLGAFDINPDAVQSLNENAAEKTGYVLDVSECRAEVVAALPNVDVFLAGPPCQGFSTAGKRDLDDPRNSLFVLAAELAREVRPKVFFLENVPAVRSGAHRKYFDMAVQVLREGGYKTAELVFDTATLGMAQRRRRLVLAAWRQVGTLNWREPAREPRSLSSCLDSFRDSAVNELTFLARTARDVEIARHIGPGQKLCNVRRGANAVHTWEIPQVFGRTSKPERKILDYFITARRRKRVRTWGDADPVSQQRVLAKFGARGSGLLQSLLAKGYLRKMADEAWDLSNTFNGKYRRLKGDRPSPTVDTRFGQVRYFLHPTENRPFAIQEAARIQGFPREFLFSGSVASKFTQIGNAVPPPLGRLLAEQTRSVLM